MIAENLQLVKKNIPEKVKLIAVSKTKPEEAIQEAYNEGQRVFGENKAQELAEKAKHLPKDIEWHFIGHLQRNKVKYIIPYVSLIHSIDSVRLLEEVNKQALKQDKIINCLLQFHIATEDTKFGLSLEEAVELITSKEFEVFNNVRIVGVMGMASFSTDTSLVKNEFNHLHSIYLTLKKDYFSSNNSFCEISMGMSGDYDLAIQAGSTMVRIGSSIFGGRNTNL